MLRAHLRSLYDLAQRHPVSLHRVQHRTVACVLRLRSKIKALPSRPSARDLPQITSTQNKRREEIGSFLQLQNNNSINTAMI